MMPVVRASQHTGIATGIARHCQTSLQTAFDVELSEQVLDCFRINANPRVQPIWFSNFEHWLMTTKFTTE